MTRAERIEVVHAHAVALDSLVRAYSAVVEDSGSGGTKETLNRIVEEQARRLNDRCSPLGETI